MLKPKYYIYYKDTLMGYEREYFEEFSNKEEINKYLADLNLKHVTYYKVMSGFDIKEWTK